MVSGECYFCDVGVFNPHAPSNCHQSLAQVYKKHEQEELRKYEQRIHDVEHGSFSPLMLSASGGAEKVTTTCLKRLLNAGREVGHGLQSHPGMDEVHIFICSNEICNTMRKGSKIIQNRMDPETEVTKKSRIANIWPNCKTILTI